jgi:XTP/dITP diphosphohydrolase
MTQKIVIATSNVGKLNEFQQLLEGHAFEFIPQFRFNIPEIEETGLTFIENAILKARAATKYTGLPAIGDDSGLEVDALNGAPGIYSSRYAGPHATFKENKQKLLAELAKLSEHIQHSGKTPPVFTCRFQCVIAYLRHEKDPTPIICQGTWEGSILTTPQGEHGFGYDPLFYVATHHCSAAQLPPEIKNRISHRGQALAQLLPALKNAGPHLT